QLYSYQFEATWSTPPCGIKRFVFAAALGALPSNPTFLDSWPIQGGDPASGSNPFEHHGPLEPEGYNFLGQVGENQWLLSFTPSSTLTVGSSVYWRLWTSSATTDLNNIFPSNAVAVTITS